MNRSLTGAVRFPEVLQQTQTHVEILLYKVELITRLLLLLPTAKKRGLLLRRCDVIGEVFEELLLVRERCIH